MSEKASEKSKDTYFNKLDVAEALKFLKDSIAAKVQCYVWTKGHKFSFHARITNISSSTRTLYLDAPSDLDLKAFSNEVKTDGDTDCFFNVILTRGSIFFRTFFKGHDVGGLRFQFPDEVFKVQRREAVRVSVPTNVPVHLEFADPFFSETRLERRAIDLSATGMAFEARETEKDAFSPGTALSAAILRLKSREIHLEAEVRNVRSFSDGKKKGLKVGVQFKNMRPADIQLISSLVFELSRRRLTG